MHVLVIGNPEAPELQAVQQKLPAGAVLVGIGGLTSSDPGLPCPPACQAGTCFPVQHHSTHCVQCLQARPFRTLQR